MLEVNYLLLPRTTQLPSLLSAKSSGAAGPAWCRQPWEGRPGQASPAGADKPPGPGLCRQTQGLARWRLCNLRRGKPSHLQLHWKGFRKAATRGAEGTSIHTREEAAQDKVVGGPGLPLPWGSPSLQGQPFCQCSGHFVKPHSKDGAGTSQLGSVPQAVQPTEAEGRRRQT